VALVAVVLAATTLVACGDDGDDEADSTTTTGAATEVEVSDAWIRPVTDLAASDRSAAYMVITGGSEDDALVAASVPADVAGTVEIHETVAAEEEMSEDGSTTTMGGMAEEGDDMSGGDDMAEGDGGMSGMMEMREVDQIDVPADTTVELEPGGLHVMLLDVQRELTPGETIDVTLTFELAGEMTVQAEVRES
jgi:copper(I)-binding protein